MKKRRSLPLPLIALAAVLVITMGAGLISLGPGRAMRLALAAATNVTIDGLAENIPDHRIPVVEVEVAQAALDSLNADLPWSGGDAHKATLLKHGIRYPCTYRYRGLVASTHYLGGKKSFRLSLKKDNPFAPFRRLNFINPKTNNFLSSNLAYWIASRMGVAVPYDELVFVRLNGRDHGVHEAFEQIDGDFERNRHLVDNQIPVYRGDYPDAVGRQWPEAVYLWASPNNWSYESQADSSGARWKLERLVAVINAKNMTDSARMDSLSQLIDIDAYVRFYASLKVLHCTHEDNTHNQWIVLSPRSGRFYPVLWDPLLLFARKDDFYPIHDAIEFHLMKDAGLRLQRDRYIFQALQELEGDSLFDRKMDQEIDRLQPSMLADRNKNGEVTEEAQDIVRYSALHWAGSCDKLRAGMHAYWRKLGDRMRIDSVSVRREGDVLIVTWSGDASIGYQVDHEPIFPPLDSIPTMVAMPRSTAFFDGTENALPVKHSMGDQARVLKDGEHWIAPHELRIQLKGTDPSDITFFNLIDHEPVAIGR